MDAGEHAIFDTASPAGILPMSLVRLDSTTPNEARALEALYLKAAQVPWVKHLAAQPGVSQYTDLHTACKYGSQDCWTRGLLVQAAVMEMLGFTHEYQTLDNVEKAASDLVEAFAYFVEHGVMFNLNNVPRFRPLMYLRIWMCIQDKVQRPKAPPNGNVLRSSMPALEPQRHFLDVNDEITAASIHGWAQCRSASTSENGSDFLMSAHNHLAGMPGFPSAQLFYSLQAQEAPAPQPSVAPSDHCKAPPAMPIVQEPAHPRPSTQSTEVPTPEELAELDQTEKLQSVFHRPINDAAQALGMGVTVLKKLCRDRGIMRWPYRKLCSVDKLIASVRQVLDEDENDEATREAYNQLVQLRNAIFENPKQDLNDWAKRLRQANFKQQYKMRHKSATLELTMPDNMNPPEMLKSAAVHTTKRRVP